MYALPVGMGMWDHTRVSDSTRREDHIFAVLPKADVAEDVNWRLSIFEGGRRLLAFDGAALLLLEVYRGRKNLNG